MRRPRPPSAAAPTRASNPGGRIVRRRVMVAAAQMRVRPRMADAARAVAAMVGRAARRGATLLVTPEMILTGYHGRFDQRERDRLIAEVLRPVCARHGVTLIVGAGSYRSA